MLSVIFVIIGIALAYVVALAVGAWLAARVPDKVTCPADGSTAFVKRDGKQAAISVFDSRDQRVVACTHWPARERCAQDCKRELTP